MFAIVRYELLILSYLSLDDQIEEFVRFFFFEFTVI